MTLRLLAIPFLAVALVAAGHSFSVIQQDLAFTRLETELSFWGRGEYQPTAATREKTGRGIESLIARAPNHPDYLTLQASQLAWEAYWTDDEQLGRRALKAQHQALENRPAHGQAWVKMIEYLTLVPGKEIELMAAKDRLKALQKSVIPAQAGIQ